MRAQILLAAVFFMAAVFITFVSLWFLQSSQPSPKIRSGSISNPDPRTFFSFQSLFSLFPPNALITLTHDNTTSFLARPAAFGPRLPAEGLRGQVWIGNDFNEFTSGGEQGCSDVPGWSTSSTNQKSYSSDRQVSADGSSKQKSNSVYITQAGHEDESSETHSTQLNSLTDISEPVFPASNDQTDDHLHYPLPASTFLNSNTRKSVQARESHADIQSLQESAEISGKIVLLSRGGCGFLEKAKWSQRRGAVALIVGDNTKDGPLIQMFAREDPLSVTIPSVFTSYTTAQLLCSIANSGSKIGRRNNANGYPTSDSNKSMEKRKKISTHPENTSNKYQLSKKSYLVEENKLDSRFNRVFQAKKVKDLGWFGSIFSSDANIDSKLERSRPPNSGRLDWMVDVSETESSINPQTAKSTKYPDSTKLARFYTTKKAEEKSSLEDGFVIGVQDWRDSDLLNTTKSKYLEQERRETSSLNSKNLIDTEKTSEFHVLDEKKNTDALQDVHEDFVPLKGGSITPSSGEYSFDNNDENLIRKKKSTENNRKIISDDFLHTIVDEEENEIGVPRIKGAPEDQNSLYDPDDEECEGLWVILSSSTGTSPILETLLVLVISPLITLTVVYALLLIRFRYRRHQWRAPKSVVKRLPVRTYQTINSSGSFSPRLPNLLSLSVTTPLLQGVPKTCCNSQAISLISETNSLLCKYNKAQDNTPRGPNHEKTVDESATWKKQSRIQEECVVCLEEYIDGVSRIMGLPCGHEFHVDCITPWLTTRRRTCPICKGDVVRSLARSTRYEPFQDDNGDEENDLGQIVHMVNSSSYPRIPINFGSRNDTV
ncbi:hypothetical protein Golomagni_02898 [Golovinomyces magnicellulatus]|nr:hypothetical protein Golomagni_02898 [Golovinomyces magnicellulatus]